MTLLTNKLKGKISSLIHLLEADTRELSRLEKKLYFYDNDETAKERLEWLIEFYPKAIEETKNELRDMGIY